MKVSKLPELRSMLAAYIWPGTYYSCQTSLHCFHWRLKTWCYIELLMQQDVWLGFVLTWQMKETFIVCIFHLCPVHLFLSADQSLLEGKVWTSQLISCKKMEKGILSCWQYYFWINRSTYTSLTIQLSRIRTHQITDLIDFNQFSEKWKRISRTTCLKVIMTQKRNELLSFIIIELC